MDTPHLLRSVNIFQFFNLFFDRVILLVDPCLLETLQSEQLNIAYYTEN